MARDYDLTSIDTCGSPNCRGCNLEDSHRTCWHDKEDVAHAAQKVLLREQEKVAVHILDPNNKPVVIFTEEYWQSLLKEFEAKHE